MRSTITTREVQPGMVVRTPDAISDSPRSQFRRVVANRKVTPYAERHITFSDGTTERYGLACEFQTAVADAYDGRGAGIRLVAAYAAF